MSPFLLWRMFCQPRSLPLSPLAGRAFLPGVSAQEQKRGFVAGGRWCFWSPALRKAERISGCRGKNRFFAVPSILLLKFGHSWGLSPPPPGLNQPWVHLQPRLWTSQGFTSPLIDHVLLVKSTEATKQKDSPAQVCTEALPVSFALPYWQAWCGEGVCGGCTGLLPGGM